ncbi:hypothetical protein M413DRAFT_13394 [Hebeloma cylindrosporum]|uniref:JmjC domain-containing protein n=1 Tax=Hebeloma cylindrosporum TaxID=76867 RepID=A0A0C2XHX4_HEBCY|nr:hypothetical protein M413DRAFT_13394 [Hebeloma cylindrosporum h7]
MTDKLPPNSSKLHQEANKAMQVKLLKHWMENNKGPEAVLILLDDEEIRYLGSHAMQGPAKALFCDENGGGDGSIDLYDTHILNAERWIAAFRNMGRLKKASKMHLAQWEIDGSWSFFTIDHYVRICFCSSRCTFEDQGKAQGEEEFAKYEAKKVRDRKSTVKYKASQREKLGLPTARKKARIEAGMGTVEPIIPPVVTGIYCQHPHGYIQQEIFPDPGVAFDEWCPYAVWADQCLTRLPYIPDPSDPDKNALETLAPHLEQLVNDVCNARGSPYVDYYPYSDEVVELGNQIQESLAKGRMVVVEGIFTFNPMKSFLHKANMYLREVNFECPHVGMTIMDFIKSRKDPNIIRAILDSATGSVESLTLIGHIDEGYVVVDKLKHLFHSWPVDMKSSHFWVLKHHPIFHMYIHRDACGTGTWTAICSGYKFWIKVVGKMDPTLYEEYLRYFLEEQGSGKWEFPCPAHSEQYCIFGKAGDIIIQPPNNWHELTIVNPSPRYAG